MLTYRHTIAGDLVTVHVPQDRDDLDLFAAWLTEADRRGPIALDTETTGLDIYSPGYRLRLVQFGDADTAWVIPWEWGGMFAEAVRAALRRIRRLLIHNAMFDWLVLDRHARVPLEWLAPRTTDTKILAALIDPRQPQEGGIGTGLKPLSAYWVDRLAPDTQAGLTAVFRSLGLTKETGWAGIPLTEPTYLLYAGLDVILTARIEPIERRELSRLGVRRELSDYEHELARICAVMQRRGIVLDVEHTRRLDDALAAEAEEFAAEAARYGVDNVNSTAQVADALAGMGESLTETTASGAVKVDKAVLLGMADMSLQWEPLGVRTPNPLATAVLRAKRASKWRTTYASTFLDTVDAAGRIHPMINTLQARTGRMSITRPALQTLPSSDQMIRRCLLADEDEVMISADFAAVEMRVLAALADVKRMQEAILGGRDLHDFTAAMVFGPNFTKAQRKLAKGIGFGKVYGGGADTIQRQTGAPMAEVREALAAYDRVYPEIKRASARWQREARATGMVHLSATGRRLPLDRDRTYAVTNYACQSTARDVLGQAMINMDEAGLTEYLRLPIHDEVLASVPADRAEEIAREIERCMRFPLYGVPIDAEAEIGGRSWGSLYGADY
ncbi:DNA polymerase [Streptacidiphilus sp. P02-A3a]|uniref:DNA polymerase n=1 Tax=Streptacidiphilus sp. P02-A3a TaxID=2704468 RepID=UPI0015FA86B9|nr:DNA polymerase [Streptacidiphilus sp. P02-A3a]QMU72122.1 DNA polymerase [Streptacidiphilus sp. P02-A3a]